MTEALAILTLIALLACSIPGAVPAYAFGVILCALAWTGIVAAFSVIGRAARHGR